MSKKTQNKKKKKTKSININDKVESTIMEIILWDFFVLPNFPFTTSETKSNY